MRVEARTERKHEQQNTKNLLVESHHASSYARIYDKAEQTQW